MKQKGAWWTVALPGRLLIAVSKGDIRLKSQSSKRVNTFECQANLQELHKPSLHALSGSVTQNSQQRNAK